jgi:hypothetical protein
LHWVILRLHPAARGYYRNRAQQDNLPGAFPAKQEKGIDVLVALAVLREARVPDTSLVILASTDTDLAPVLDEAFELHLAKIETVSWWSPDHRNQQLRADRAVVWNTRAFA